MPGLKIDGGSVDWGAALEDFGSACKALRLPLRDLGGVHIELGSQFRRGLVTLEGGQRDLGPEEGPGCGYDGIVCSCGSPFSWGVSCPDWAEIPLIGLFRLMGPAFNYIIMMNKKVS